MNGSQERFATLTPKLAANVAPEQYETPLFSGLVRHAARNTIPFHIPGHKRGKGMDPEFRDFIGEAALSIDLINIAPVDDLHHPHGIIKEAQDLAAQAFGADRTFFSVQGTSGAIMTMILATCKPGDKLLIPRNVHKSVLTAVVLAGVQPVFMDPELDPDLGVAHGVGLVTVRETLRRHPDAKALLVVNPTYFGVCVDLAGIVEEAHRYDIPVLVDEAHGAHVYFHPELPISAMEAGADLAATSIHKLGGSLTQSSILNMREGLVSPGRVQTVLSMLTTTSTSYILLASLDAARRYLAVSGREQIDHALRLARDARERINAIPGYWCLGPDAMGNRTSSYALDETKLCVSVKDLGITGAEVERILRDEFRIEVELSDLYNILCIISFGDTEASVDALVDALHAISLRYVDRWQSRPLQVRLPEPPELAVAPRDAFYADTESVPLGESAGRIAAEFVMVYPPGIPILLPGERITERNVVYIQQHIAAGLPVQGPDDETLAMLRVLK